MLLKSDKTFNSLTLISSNSLKDHLTIRCLMVSSNMILRLNGLTQPAERRTALLLASGFMFRGNVFMRVAASCKLILLHAVASLLTLLFR